VRFTWGRAASAFALYLTLAVVQAWPLPANLGTHLTGPPTGDTGVYVWNTWVFRHEILERRATPLSTQEILPLAGPVDLSLHNYTIFSNLLALPLLSVLDVVTTFNVVYLVNVALAGLGMFLLARRLTGGTAESLVAGLLFAWSPFLVARSQAHFSLVAAAPLPIFMWALFRAWDTQRLRDAVLAGAVIAWAAFCDPYYAVYCLMLGTVFLGGRVLSVTFVRRPARELGAARHMVDIGIATIALLIIGVNILGGGQLQWGPLRVSMRTLYTPMLLLTVLVVLRAVLMASPRISWVPVPSRRWLIRAAVACGIMAALLMSPTLYAVGVRVIEGRMVSAPVLWRSSAPGVDLLGVLAPNPNHAWAPEALVRFLSSSPGGFVEQVASFSWIAIAVIVAAWRFAGARPNRFWLWLTCGFALLTLGPFIVAAGVNTAIPTPWALLRYVPIIGAARMPARFGVVVALGLAVLFAYALVALGRRYPARRPFLLPAVAVLLALELVPAPRTLYSAALPAVFERVKADPRDIRVLSLPTGVRDGLSSMGNFSAATQFYQTMHGKGLIGGYLSRVSDQRKSAYRRVPVMHALLEVSEGRKLSRREIDAAIATVDDFARRTNLGYVVMNTAWVTDDVRDFAVILFGLTKVAEADGFELYVPRSFD
jgi:hypothetical protein